MAEDRPATPPSRGGVAPTDAGLPPPGCAALLYNAQVPDTLSVILEICRTTATGERRERIVERFGGTHLYIPRRHDLEMVRQLIAAGVRPRTARFKVRGR
jgi:hypothetical protein